LTKRSTFAASLVPLVLVGTLAVSQKDDDLTRPDPAILATDHVKEILLVMHTDKNAKITREQWMRFMAEEFDRLDSDKSGTLDPKKIQLERERIKHTRFIDSGK
jgi:hypothetical protein